MHFDKKGPVNTDAVIDLAVKRAKELGVRHVVVASNTGETAKKLLECGMNVACITHHTGYAKPGDQEMSSEVMDELRTAGVKLLTTTHFLGGIDRAVENKFGGSYPGGIVAHTLRMLGQGIKVCVEISVMALDGGLIPYGEDVVVIGGSGRGADTAVVMRPAHGKDFFATRVWEIICKPQNF
jgi:hypothetical protein